MWTGFAHGSYQGLATEDMVVDGAATDPPERCLLATGIAAVRPTARRSPCMWPPKPPQLPCLAALLHSLVCTVSNRRWVTGKSLRVAPASAGCIRLHHRRGWAAACDPVVGEGQVLSGRLPAATVATKEGAAVDGVHGGVDEAAMDETRAQTVMVSWCHGCDGCDGCDGENQNFSPSVPLEVFPLEVLLQIGALDDHPLTPPGRGPRIGIACMRRAGIPINDHSNMLDMRTTQLGLPISFLIRILWNS